jgi:pyruvate formate lyase activating enzyme
MRDTPATPSRTLQRVRENALRNGRRDVDNGNGIDPASESTYCHQCNERLIRRDGYRVSGL